MLIHGQASDTPPKRVVIIGRGFIGAAVAGAVSSAGIPLLALGRREVDLLAPNAAAALLERLQPDDSVLFTSAIAPAKTGAQLVDNLRMAEQACEALANKPPAHLVYLSSDAVYADWANPVTEDSPIAPSTLHGMMHAARELMFRSAYAGPFAALRPTLVFGARDPHNGYGPNRFRRQAASGRPVTIFGEGEEKRDHVAVEDVAALALRILLRRSAGALNAVTGKATSFHDIARQVASLSDPPVAVESVARPGPRPHLLHRFFDITGCRRAFPDFRFEPLSAGLRRVQQEAGAGVGAV